MIQSIEVTNYHGESKLFKLLKPSESGCLITSITGLGPPKATINTISNTVGDGATFASSRVTTRNIVVTFKPLDSPNIETVRQELYRYFPIKQQLRFTIKTDNRYCYTIGYVESNEPSIFSNNETIKISIICPDSYFYAAGDGEYSITSFLGISGAFEFPFENDSISQKLLEFGNLNMLEEKSIVYNGDADIGVTITAHALGDVSGFAIYKTRTGESMAIDSEKLITYTGSDIKQGDDIIINTVAGSKSIELYRDGDYINILNCLVKGSNWFKLVKGDNIFAFTATSGATNLQVQIQNRVAYEGV